MKTSLPVVRPRSPRSDPDGSDQVQSLIIPTKLVPVADSLLRITSLFFDLVGSCRFTTSQIPTDLSIQVQDVTFVVLSSWRDTIIVLKSCETLSPWAENLQIVRRCCDSIAYKATRDILTTGNIGEGWWSNDLATIRIDYFVRIITAISAKGAKPEILGRCIRHYAERWLPDMDLELEGLRGHGYGRDVLQFCILNGRKEEGSIGHKEQRMIIESLVSILPPQNEAVPCKFLLQLLKMAMVYSATPALISELEKRVGMTLEEATVNDLLIPSRDCEGPKSLHHQVSSFG